jgi:D-alanine-D-alanine ligase
LKWNDFDGIAWRAVEDADLAERLRSMARQVFVNIGGRGYGRLDVRSDPSGESLYFLEINPNCGVFYPPGAFGSADFIIELDPSTSHNMFLEGQLACALHHHQLKQPVFQSIWKKDRGFGLYATRDIAVGEVIQRGEMKPTVLTSRGHVERNWSTELKHDFKVYAWPISKEVYATWSDDPHFWEPINHSCKPNTWFSGGLDTVARKPIKSGEEITIDYATFYTYSPAFNCGCRSTDCRREITSVDWKIPEMIANYFGHTSLYITAEVHRGIAKGCFE